MKSDINYIKSLVGKWEEGSISSSEEMTLKEYLLKGDVKDDMLLDLIPILGLDRLSSEAKKEREEFIPNLDFIAKEKEIKASRKKPAVKTFVVSTISLVAAAIALFVFIGREPLCYINGKAVHSEQQALAVVDYLDMLSSLNEMPEELDALSTINLDIDF